MTRRARVVVCGAGPAGSAAAYRLARRGVVDVVLLESGARPGGHAGSITVGGLRVDLGSHRLHPSCAREIRRDVDRVLADPMVDLPRHGRIRLAGRWLDFPLRPLDLATSLPPRLAARLARDLFAARRRPGDSFGDVLLARFGPVLCEEFWFPYCRKLWGVEPWELSPTQARVRVSAASGLAVVGRALKSALAGPARFAHPSDGFGSIFEALVGAAGDLGAEVRLGTPATRLVLDAGPRLRGVDTPEIALAADLCLSTLPLPLLVGLAGTAADAPVRAAAASLRHRGMVLVYFVLDVHRFREYDAHYLPSADVCVSRLSEPRNYTDAWPPGRTVLCAEVPCGEGDTLWTEPEATLVQRVRCDLARSDLALPAQEAEAVVVRLDRVYPLFRHGFEDAVARIERWVDGVAGLVTFGRQGLFLHDNSHHAMGMGYAAADCVTPGGGFDGRAWALARERFAGCVVED